MDRFTSHTATRVTTVMLLLILLNGICAEGNLGLALIYAGFEVVSSLLLVLLFGTIPNPIFPKLAIYSHLLRDYGFKDDDYIWLLCGALISIGLGLPLIAI